MCYGIQLNSRRRISGSILSEPKPQHTPQWHLIAGYIDKEFYEEMDNIEDKDRLYAELTYYEKIFFGMFHRLQEP